MMKSPKGSKDLVSRGALKTTSAVSTVEEPSRVEVLIQKAESAARSGNDDQARDCLAAVFETLSAYQMNRRPANLDAESAKAGRYQIARSA